MNRLPLVCGYHEHLLQVSKSTMLTIFSIKCNKFCYSELYSYISQLNKTPRSVHFGVVVVELINCKCAGP